ncbi:unnamed protein product [Tuber aestivum]|uniref:Zn(2)-C6 fungal-type domain-containing protein n=1 Tax=Tuber aestivum TaxID=59557 RepID=A0A292PU22_9PEZI|nr:unnamed protein product [Tuber aestivum]
MEIPSDTPGTYAPYDTVPGAPVADANGRHLSYSSCSDTGGSNSATDGYSSATSSSYVEYVPAGYHQGHVQQHGGMAPVQQPYVTHPQQPFHSSPQVHQPGPAPYEHTGAYTAGMPPQFQPPQQIPQQHQHPHQQSPTSMNTPIPQTLPLDAAPDHGHNNGAAGPEQQQQQQQQRQQQQRQQPQQQQQKQYQRIARFVGPPPVANACTECRGRHLKCDAGVPSCGRCVADGRECSYVKSRRGWKGSRRQKMAAEKMKNQSDDGSDTNGKSSSALDCVGLAY